jgi:predicted nicotinamide N-methyase
MAAWHTIEERAGRADLDPPFWAVPWAGGQALARYVLDYPETVAGRRVIDIASGSGLVAIAAALAGACAVTAYDIDPLAVTAITVNAAANGVEVTPERADILADDAQAPDGTDVVLVADAFYEKDLGAQVLQYLERSAARGAQVLAGDFGRAYLPRDRLVPLESYLVTGLFIVEGIDLKSTTIWTLGLPPRSHGGLAPLAGTVGWHRWPARWTGTVGRHGALAPLAGTASWPCG